MADYAAKLKELLRANQCRFERQGKGLRRVKAYDEGRLKTVSMKEVFMLRRLG